MQSSRFRAAGETPSFSPSTLHLLLPIENKPGMLLLICESAPLLSMQFHANINPKIPWLERPNPKHSSLAQPERHFVVPLMPIQDLSVAQEECRLCFGRWQREMEGLRALVEDASQYTAVAFLQSVHARIPAIHRAGKAVLARLSILIQVMVETENETDPPKPSNDFTR